MSKNADSHHSPGHHTWRRVVVKVGTNLLTAGSDRLSPAAIATITHQIADLRRSGIEVVLVTSGAVAAGQAMLNGHGGSLPRHGIANRQVLASLGQSSLMAEYSKCFEREGFLAAQALVSRTDLESDHGYLNTRNALLGVIQVGAIPVVNENDVVAIEELEGEVFGDNDRLSARVADVVDADTLVILSDVDGLYDRDPHLDEDAVRIPEVRHIGPEIRAAAGLTGTKRGRGGMATKLDAAEIATRIGTSVIIASGTEPDVLMRLSNGEDLGTRFLARSSRLESSKRRILATLRADSGRVVVNSGAVSALLQRGSSLLPPGVLSVSGQFERGTNIAVCDEGGTVIAAGRANYSSADVERIKGLQSGEARAIVDNDYGDEVIHRNNMVLVDHDSDQDK